MRPALYILALHPVAPYRPNGGLQIHFTPRRADRFRWALRRECEQRVRTLSAFARIGGARIAQNFAKFGKGSDSGEVFAGNFTAPPSR